MSDFDPRRTLLERLGVLTGREEAIARHLRGEDGRLEADFGDIATFTAGDEVLEGLEDAALEEIAQIRAALVRLQRGTWGICARCGEAIESERLRALPATAFCRTCAA
jgi:DnaK suppressor protein